MRNFDSQYQGFTSRIIRIALWYFPRRSLSAVAKIHRDPLFSLQCSYIAQPEAVHQIHLAGSALRRNFLNF